jgi:hypothetical protein
VPRAFSCSRVTIGIPAKATVALMRLFGGGRSADRVWFLNLEPSDFRPQTRPCILPLECPWIILTDKYQVTTGDRRRRHKELLHYVFFIVVRIVGGNQMQHR